MTETDTEKLQRVLQGVGASKIIYSLVMPETEAVKRRVFLGPFAEEVEQLFADSEGGPRPCDVIHAVERATAVYFSAFREAWTQKQDAMHNELFDLWLKWSSPIVLGLPGDFSYRYPTAGASEALRALIDEYGARARREKFNPEIHQFDGDYEGFSAYAEAAYIRVTRHNRGDWRGAVTAMAAASAAKPIQLYISAPSAIDGNAWPDLDVFMTDMVRRSPRAEVILDLTYVGCIHKEVTIRADYPNVPAIVFSLSKPMGAYYDRIGGLLARPNAGKEPYPGLFGNKWFKNLTSLAIGTEFMKSYGVYELPCKYAPVQQASAAAIESNLRLQDHDVHLKPCDVFLLACGEMPAKPADIHRYLQRPADGRPIVRVCLTPTMATMIGTACTPEVSPRYYEKL